MHSPSQRLWINTTTDFSARRRAQLGGRIGGPQGPPIASRRGTSHWCWAATLVERLSYVFEGLAVSVIESPPLPISIVTHNFFDTCDVSFLAVRELIARFLQKNRKTYERAKPRRGEVFVAVNKVRGEITEDSTLSGCLRILFVIVGS